MDWKILLAVLVGLSLITTGVVKQGNFEFLEKYDEMSEKIKGLTGEIIGSFPSSASDVSKREIDVKAEFSDPNFDMNNKKIDFTIKFNPINQDHDLFVNGNKITSGSQITLNIFGYSGLFQVHKTLQMSGEADKIKVNGLTIEGAEKKITIETDGLSFDEIDFEGLKKDIELSNMNGKLTLHGKMSIKVDKEPVKIQAFMGNVHVTPYNLTIDGKAKRVLISGEDYSASFNS
ncbi:MAG: hypothetical protein J7L45_03035 [Candidatus Aenigmarchaeota archaeon]|nr:hypothetical protein [Candidatus Aenigmarchaeota archaeon]